MESLLTSDFRILYFYKFKRGRNGAEAARNINSILWDNAVNEQTIRFWFQKFANGDFILEDQERGRPKPSINDENLKAVVENDPKASVRELATNFNVSIGTISNHLKAIGKQKRKKT